MEVYQKNFMIREQISIVIKSENIPEKSLSKQYKFWKIFCIIRREGNEGKSCCQSYIQSLYGFLTSLTKQLTFCISWVDVHLREQIFSLQPLTLYPVWRVFSITFGMIKDGYAQAPKFHGSLLRIKKPNLIVVFSNRDPRICSLSHDRWKIYADSESWKGMWKKQLDDHTVTANKKTVLENDSCKYMTLNKNCHRHRLLLLHHHRSRWTILE